MAYQKDTHLHHREEHFTGNAVVRDIVIGMADGLTVPFALAAGLAGAVSDMSIILTAGAAEIAAGAIAMGLGGFMAGRSEVEHFKSELAREFAEVKAVPEKEEAEIVELLIPYGITEATAKQVVTELKQDPDKWVDFMMRYELNLEQPSPRAAQWSALRIGFSYIAGGIVPLLPYMFAKDTHEALLYSAGFTLVILLVFGYLKALFSGRKAAALRSAFETALIGGLAAGAAYGLARLLGH
jgi:vacuolar iron transporter family protein